MKYVNCAQTNLRLHDVNKVSHQVQCDVDVLIPHRPPSEQQVNIIVPIVPSLLHRSPSYWPLTFLHGIMGRRFPDGGLLRYRKWVPQQLGDVNKQESGDSRPMGARHGDTAANHTDLLSGCGRTYVFGVQAWSNLWDLISEPPSHYSMIDVKVKEPYVYA